MGSDTNRYQIRPQSYKSDMSSTAAFSAIKHHLSTMPGKPEQSPVDHTDAEFDRYIRDANPPKIVSISSEMRETTPREEVKVTADTASERLSEVKEAAINLGPRPAAVVTGETASDDKQEEIEAADGSADEDYEDEYNEDAVVSEKVAEEEEEAKSEQPERAREESELNVDDLLGEDEQQDQSQKEEKEEVVENSEEMISMHDKFEASEPKQEDDRQEEEEEQEIDLDDLEDDLPADAQNKEEVDDLEVHDNDNYSEEYHDDDEDQEEDEQPQAQEQEKEPKTIMPKYEKVEDDQAEQEEPQQQKEIVTDDIKFEKEEVEPVISQDDALKLLEMEQAKQAKNEDDAPNFDDIGSTGATSDNYSEM